MRIVLGAVGVIVGFVVAFVVVMVTFFVAMTALGPEGTYKAGTYWTTDAFNVITLIGGTIGAALGGLLCGLISRSRTALMVFVSLIVVTGLLGAVMQMNKPDPPPAAAPPTFKEIAEHGKEPTWYAFTKVALGAGGVLVGGWSVAGRRKKS